MSIFSTWRSSSERDMSFFSEHKPRSFIRLISLFWLLYIEIILVEPSCDITLYNSCGRFQSLPALQNCNQDGADNACKSICFITRPQDSTENSEDPQDCCWDTAQAPFPDQVTDQSIGTMMTQGSVAASGSATCCCDPQMATVQITSDDPQLPPDDEDDQGDDIDESKCGRILPMIGDVCDDDRKCLYLCQSNGISGRLHVCKGLDECCCDYDLTRGMVDPYESYFKGGG